MSAPPPFQQIKVVTNSFPIKKLPTRDYHQYDVTFQPPLGEKKFRNKRMELFHHLQNSVYALEFKVRGVYDGNNIFYTPQPFPSDRTFNVKLGVDSPVPAQTNGSYAMRFTLTSGAVIKPSDVNDLIINKRTTTRAITATNLIQLVIRQGPNLHNTNNGRAYFTAVGKKDLHPHGLELWRGIFQSVRPTMGKMILTVDTSVAAVYRGGDLITVAMDYLKARAPRELVLDPQEPRFKKLERFLNKLRVDVRTGPGGKRSRIKTIRGLEAMAGEFEFTNGEGRTMRVKDYFRETYNVHIEYSRIVGIRLSPKSGRDDIVPLELCTIRPGQLYKKKLPEELTKDMVTFSAVKPHERRRMIQSEVQHFGSEYIVESGMELDGQLLTVNAKLLRTPGIQFNPQDRSLMPERGGWNVTKARRLNNPNPLRCWGVLNFCVDRLSINTCMNTLERGLAACCKKLGIVVDEPLVVKEGRCHDVRRSLQEVLDTAISVGQKRWGGNPEEVAQRVMRYLIIIVILPDKAAPIRTTVKHWGDVEKGIATNCLRYDKVQNANDQYWNNVAIKLNARLGGCNSTADSPVMHQLKREPFMIMGADVGHPGPGEQKPSITSLTFSYDINATQYVALTGIQAPRLEIIADLEEYVRRAMLFYAGRNPPPTRLIFFRDGVSEGEYEQVAQQEIQAITGAIDKLWVSMKVNAPKPKLTFIVVGKRHHAVFFPAAPPAGHDPHKGNCAPGSVIDSDITHPSVRDFYLQSHGAIQGTSRSSHYIVLRDDNFNFNLQVIQDLSFALCHVYAKATRSVSIPAPVYYADLVCSRGAFHMDPSALGLRFDDGASTSSGSSQTFDLEAWRSAFRPLHSGLGDKMYFL